MTYLSDFDVSYDISTTERATGRTVNGEATYTKLVKWLGALSTGNNAVAHGITGLLGIVRCETSVLRSTTIRGTEILILPFVTSTFSFACSIDFDATNMNIRVGTGWTGTNNILAGAWAMLEFTKS